MPEHVLFDNAKSMVIDRDAYGEGLHRWNDELKELAEGCGFTLRLCRPYRAKTKGKVERVNSYLKGSFVVPLAATLDATGLKLDAEVANVHVRPRLDQVANARVHATTKAVPAARLAKERAVTVEPAAPAVGVRRAAGGAGISLQHQRINELCEQLKLAGLGAQWPALAQDGARDEATTLMKHGDHVGREDN